MKTTFKVLAGYSFYILIAFFIGGCGTIRSSIEKHQEKKANAFFNKNPGKDAQRCADRFPIKDSAGPVRVDSTKKAGNIDYTKAIDSLNNVADSISKFWLGVVNDSHDLTVEDLQKKLKDAQAKSNDLQTALKTLYNQYKPCKADTVYLTATNYLLDGAATIAAEEKYNAEQKLRTAAEQKLSSVANQNKVRLWMLVASIVLNVLLLLAIAFILRTKKII